jgi:GT2 family glycosyltransferase
VSLSAFVSASQVSEDPGVWRYARARTALAGLGAGPAVSVVVPTVGRWRDLHSCLDGLRPQLCGDDEVIVVDNSPAGAPAGVAADGVVVIPEPRVGASWARNTGWRAARHEVVAFLDDDTRPDRCWLATVRARVAGVDLLTGGVLGGNADAHAACVMDEEYALHRGWLPRRFGDGGEPCGPGRAWQVGTGACMIWRRSALEAIGGFDPALGNGTPGGGAEDLDAFARVLRAGSRALYDPRVLVWHRHPGSAHELGRTIRLYSRALGGHAAKLLVEDDARRAAVQARRQVVDGYRMAFRSLAPDRHLPVAPQLLFLADFAVGAVAFARHRRQARGGDDVARRGVRMATSPPRWTLPQELDVAGDEPDGEPVARPTPLLLRNGGVPVGLVRVATGASVRDGVGTWASFVAAGGGAAW